MQDSTNTKQKEKDPTVKTAGSYSKPVILILLVISLF